MTYAHDLQAFTFQMHPSASAPGDAPAFECVEPLGYLDVERDVQNGYFETVGLRFTVQKSVLPEGATLDDVALYRVDDGSWTKVDTSRQGTTFEATANGFATFAVGVDVTADEEPTTEAPTTTTPEDATTTAPDESAGTTTPEDGQPGFGIVVGPVALLGAVVLRRPRD